MALTPNPEICALFHRFGIAAVTGNITYAEGTPIRILQSPNPDDPFGNKFIKRGPWSYWYPRQNLDTGLGVVQDVEFADFDKLEVEPWTINMIDLPLPPGQTWEVTIRHSDYVFDIDMNTPIGEDPLRSLEISRVDNATIYKDVRWSYRLLGQTGLTSVQQAGRTVVITVPTNVTLVPKVGRRCQLRRG